MDYDPHQNQSYQQYQEDYQQEDYQQQQYQQEQYQQPLQQQSSSQPCDPSQAQSYDYDPSVQAYYPTYPQPYQIHNPTSEPYPQNQQYLQQQQQQQPHQPYPSYHQPDYASAAYQQPFQTDPNSGQFPAANVPAPPEAPQLADAYTGASQPQHNAYYPQELPHPHPHPHPHPQPQPQLQQQTYTHSHPQQPQKQLMYDVPQQSAYDVPPGLSPAAAAAVAALSQLTQFAGKMEAAERAMAERQWRAHNEGFGPMMAPHMLPHPHAPVNFGRPVGRPPYGRGGRRGGAQFRGGRSNFGHQRPRPDGGAPRFHGKGLRVRGGGGRFAHAPQASALWPHLESASTQEQKRRGPQVAWCDVCRVDCNTQEILEQHMNGKRHKKNAEKFENFQKYGEILSELQPKLADQGENGQGSEQNNVFDTEKAPDASATESLPDASASENLQWASAVENLPSGAAADEKKMEVGQQIQIGEQTGLPNVEEPTEELARKPWACRFEDQMCGPEWKQMEFGQGGKRLTQVNQAQGEHGSYSPVGMNAHHVLHTNEREGDDQPSNGQARKMVAEHQDQQDPELQGQNSMAEPEPKVPEGAIEAIDPGSDMVKIEEKGMAMDNANTGALPDLIIMQGVSAPDFGVSSTDHAVQPGLESAD